MHDIRNGLTIVRANFEAFIDGKLEPAHERLRVLMELIGRIDSMLDEIETTDENGAHR